MQIGKNSYIHFCDNLCERSGIPSLQDDSLHLVFTSPPYWNYIDYAGDKGIGKEDDYHNYIDSLDAVFQRLYRKVIPGGKFVINVSNMHSRLKVEKKAFLYPIAFVVAELARKAGFVFKDEIIWHKAGGNAGSLGGKMLFGSYPFPPTPKFLSSMFEYIFVFAKDGKHPKVEKAEKEKDRLTKEEWLEYTSGIWRVSPEKDQHHPATFPFEIAQRVVRLFTFKGDTVLDPFAGSGTTVIAAEKFSRHGIGFEIAEAYQKAVENKVSKHLDQLTIKGL